VGRVRLVRAIVTCQSRWNYTVSAWMGVTFGGFCHYLQGVVAASLLNRKLSLSTSLRNRLLNELRVFKMPESLFLTVHQAKHGKADSFNSYICHKPQLQE